ncbi:MAG: sugar transferase [Clostridia bacterium]|nr:sugar transferase [Clostridia bacterium]
MYSKYLKRILDFTLALIALIVLSPLLVVFLLIGAIVMKGRPVFRQQRPGIKDENGNEKIFYLLKFRSMTNEKDKSGDYLPDGERLTSYGKFIRETSIDELPSLINIIKGELSIVGPRPQLVKDMVFMTPEQRRRHNVRPGLTGLAQVNGRNNITWEEKLEWDIKYIDSGITFLGDVKIILKTIGKVLKRSDIVNDTPTPSADFGDWLLETGKINQDEYNSGQQEAKELLGV